MTLAQMQAHAAALNQASQLGVTSIQAKHRPSTHVEGLITRMACLAVEASTIDGMLNEIHERAFGPLPEKGNDQTSVREAPSGAHGAATGRLDDIEAVLGRIRAKVEQLAAFV